MRLRALAKINLGLDIIGKREDGYHEVRMIMQTIQMYDVLDIRKTKRPGISLSTNLPYIPTDERNLVYKAAKLLMDEFHLKEGLNIKLAKSIPVAAGMAGGSSDAAAAFVGMNQLFSLNITQEKLMEYGVSLGADIPYCIMRGTALSEGIGEILTPLPPVPGCWFLIVKPGFSMSTKFVYEHLTLDEHTVHPDIDGMVDALGRRDLDGVAGRLGNVLEQVTKQHYPAIDELKTIMNKNGALNSLMSGSGPTVFGIFTSREKAENAARACRRHPAVRQTAVVRPFNKSLHAKPSVHTNR